MNKGPRRSPRASSLVRKLASSMITGAASIRRRISISRSRDAAALRVAEEAMRAREVECTNLEARLEEATRVDINAEATMAAILEADTTRPRGVAMRAVGSEAGTEETLREARHEVVAVAATETTSTRKRRLVTATIQAATLSRSQLRDRLHRPLSIGPLNIEHHRMMNTARRTTPVTVEAMALAEVNAAEEVAVAEALTEADSMTRRARASTRREANDPLANSCL